MRSLPTFSLIGTTCCSFALADGKPEDAKLSEENTGSARAATKITKYDRTDMSRPTTVSFSYNIDLSMDQSKYRAVVRRMLTSSKVNGRRSRRQEYIADSMSSFRRTFDQLDGFNLVSDLLTSFPAHVLRSGTPR